MVKDLPNIIYNREVREDIDEERTHEWLNEDGGNTRLHIKLIGILLLQPPLPRILMTI